MQPLLRLTGQYRGRENRPEKQYVRHHAVAPIADNLRPRIAQERIELAGNDREGVHHLRARTR